MNAVADILDEAAAVLARNGWYQGDFYQPLRDDSDGTDVPPRDCPVCGLGAIMVAAGMDPDDDDLRKGTPAWDAAAAFAAHLLRLKGSEVITTNYVIAVIGEDWNDDDGRTAEQVISELKACAATQRQAGYA